MKRFLKIVFGSLRLSYLLKNYFIGALFFIPLMFNTVKNVGQWYQSPISSFVILVIYTLMYVLYPFAMFVYDSIVDTLFNGFVYEINIINMFIIGFWVFFRTIILYLFSIFIAPIGMLYLYFARRRYYDEEELHERIYEEDYQT